MLCKRVQGVEGFITSNLKLKLTQQEISTDLEADQAKRGYQVRSHEPGGRRWS